MPTEKIKLKIIVHPDHATNHKNYPELFNSLLTEAKRRIFRLAAQRDKFKNHIFVYLAANRFKLKKIFEFVDEDLFVKNQFRFVSPHGNFFDLSELEKIKENSSQTLDLNSQADAIAKLIIENLSKIAEIEIWGFGRGACATRLQKKLQEKFPILKIELGDEKILKKNP